MSIAEKISVLVFIYIRRTEYKAAVVDSSLLILQ